MIHGLGSMAMGLGTKIQGPSSKARFIIINPNHNFEVINEA